MPAEFGPLPASAIKRAGHPTVGIEEPQPRGVGAADPFAALFELVGPERHEPVFKALTKILHPDAGGDGRLQQQLNDARDQLDD
jgi:hypothetical protein